VIASRVLKVWGESESGLNQRLDDVIARLDEAGDVTLAFLARGWNGLEVRLTTRAADATTALTRLDPWELEIRTLLGPIVFGADEDSMESVVLDMCRQRGLTLGLAESLTGGLVAARLSAISGASDVLRGSVVSYASDVKFDVLGVTPGPVVSEAAAREMAEGARKVLGSDIGVALTGVAGPLPQPGEPDVPVGTVCIAVIGPGDASRSTTLNLSFSAGRQQVREFSVITALDLLRRHLTEPG
jgi:nicotinamide-nucleotide amidase